MWWRVMRVVIPVACALSAVALFPLTLPYWEEARDVMRRLPPLKSFLLAAGVTVLLMPCRDTDLIVSSQKEITVWQLKTVAVCLFAGTAVFSVNFCLAFARTAGWAPYLLYAVATTCACALPFFYRAPFWRVVAATLLFTSALLPFHLRNFF